MDINKIEKLAYILQSNNLSLIELQENGDMIRIEKNHKHISLRDDNSSETNLVNSKDAYNSNLSVDSTSCNDNKTIDINEEKLSNNGNYNEIKSPMVGVFYESPSPGAESFVKVGDIVKKGDIVCIIEAMKLMNEIMSDFDGEIVEVLVKDGDVVDYSQALFKIK